MKNSRIDRFGRWLFSNRTWEKLPGTALTVAAATSFAIGVAALAATPFGTHLTVALVPHAADLIVTGLTGLVTGATTKKEALNPQQLTQPISDGTAGAVDAEKIRAAVQLEIERMRDAYRYRALNSITALGAYVAIGVPVAFFSLWLCVPFSLNSRRSSLLLVMRISGWCGFLAPKPRQFR